MKSPRINVGRGPPWSTTSYLWGTPKLAGAGKMRKNHKGDQECQEGRMEVSQELCSGSQVKKVFQGEGINGIK